MEWISVKEMPPHKKILATNGKQVIITNGSRFSKTSDGRITAPANYGTGMEVLYWMLIPELPKEDA